MFPSIPEDPLKPLLIQGDGLRYIQSLADHSVDMILTDPPYFLEGFDHRWNPQHVAAKAAKAQVVHGLPVAMRYDPQQGPQFGALCTTLAFHAFRILKPGGFFVVFSQARLYHHAAIAIESQGFEIRDMLGWVYEGQAKAFSQDHFVDKMSLSEEEKKVLKEKLEGRKTPQLKPMMEPLVLAQKPKDGTFIENWLQHRVGLIDPHQRLDEKFPGTLMAVPKPKKAERLTAPHPTLKPQVLLQHLIGLFTPPQALILDPFTGSASTLVAATAMDRRSIGVELSPVYIDMCQKRLTASGHTFYKMRKNAKV